MHKLILVKHSLPRIEPDVPAGRWHLSDEGVVRCKPLADALAPYSPAQSSAAGSPRPVRPGSAWRDIWPWRAERFRTCTSTTAATYRCFHGRTLSVWFGGSSTSRSGWSSDARRPPRRWSGSAGRSTGCSRAQASCVVVVSHGTVISLLVSERTGCEPFDLWRRAGAAVAGGAGRSAVASREGRARHCSSVKAALGGGSSTAPAGRSDRPVVGGAIPWPTGP